MKIIKIMCIVFIVLLISITPVSAGLININIPDWIKDCFTDSQRLQILTVTPESTTVLPNEEIIYTIMFYNQHGQAFDYQADAYIGDTRVGRSPFVTLAPGESANTVVIITAPSSTGTYTVELYSYFGSGTEPYWWEWDDEYFTMLTVSSGTPTSTPTATPTGTPTATPTGTPPPVNIPPIPSVTKTVTGNVYSYDASASTDPDGTIVSYSWTVDDLAAGTGQTFEIDGSTFSSGIHTTKLIITDNSGAASTYTHTITVSVEDETVIIESGDESTIEGDTEVSPLTTEQGDALFVMNVGGQPFYIPGFSAIFAIAGLLAVAYLFYRERHD